MSRFQQVGDGVPYSEAREDRGEDYEAPRADGTARRIDNAPSLAELRRGERQVRASVDHRGFKGR